MNNINETIKIGMVGTHGIGKTEYVKMLYNWFINDNSIKYTKDDIAYIYEIVRDCPYQVNEKTSLKAQKWILDNQIDRERHFYELNKKIIITDRTVIDNFAYLLYAKRVSAKDMKVKDVVKYAGDVDFWLDVHPYNIIFYIRIPNNLEYNEITIYDDGFRSINKKFQLEIDKIIEVILINRFNLNVIDYYEIDEEYVRIHKYNNIFMINADYGNLTEGFNKILEVIKKYNGMGLI